MIQSMLSNLAIILLLHLLMVTFNNSKNRLIKKFFLIIVISIFSAATIVMFYLPIELGNYYVDLRAIPLILLAYIRGWKPLVPVLLIASLWRFMMGGEGVIPSIVFGMVAPSLFALLFHNKNVFQSNYIKKIVIATICWFISDFPIVFFVPNGLEVFQKYFFIRYISFLGAALILFSFIMMERRRQILSEQLQFYATHDPLTGLTNRRTFMEMMEEKILSVDAKEQCIAMIDIDHFKKINDTYGHIFGDEVLIKIASELKKYESEQLHIARFGGEEFIVYINKPSLREIEILLTEMKDKIANMRFKVNNQSIQVTISIGVAKYCKGDDLITVISHADNCLYQAKDHGRNRLELCSCFSQNN